MANVFVLDVGATLTHWGFAGEDLPNQRNASAWCLANSGWSTDACNFLEFREHYIPHFFQTFNRLPQFLKDYTAQVVPSKYQLSEKSCATGALSYITCRTSYQRNLEHISNFYRDPSTSMQAAHLLVTEPTKRTLSHTALLAELAFEAIGLENFFSVRKAPLAAFALGRPTALVVETGAMGTRISPVFEGYALQRHIDQYCVGGALQECMLASTLDLWDLRNSQFDIKFNPYPKCDEGALEKVDPRYLHHSRKAVVADLAHSTLRIKDPNTNYAPDDEEDDTAYELPDGKTLFLRRKQVESITDFVFEPLAASQTKDALTQFVESLGPSIRFWPGLANAVIGAAFACDIEIVPSLLNNVVVCGGPAATHGYLDRLGRELAAARECDVGKYDRWTSGGSASALRDVSGLKIRVAAQHGWELPMTTWIGGSMVANLAAFDSYWINKAEWAESGRNILEKRIVF